MIRLLNWNSWLFWVSVLIVIALIILLVVIITRRRSGAAEIEIREPTERPFPVFSLVNIWRAFLREIPPEFRRSIMWYEPYVVFGESGVGKSRLIDACTDWKGQARQFYPSYAADPQLQIYLGSEVIVQEIPPALLNDTSQSARAALQRLWKPFFRKKEPNVVVVLNAADLISESPETLKVQAQMIRGKINILSRMRNKPIKTCVALTHMDQREGFLEFVEFLNRNDTPLNLEFKSKDELKNLSDCLQPYEKYLSYALTTVPAHDYLKILTFFKHTPELFNTVSTFIKILQTQDSLSIEPEIVRLSLTSQKEHDRVTSDPFTLPIKDREFSRTHPQLQHRIAAAVLLIMGLLYLGTGYLYERHLLKNTDRKMDAMQMAPPPLEQYDQKIHRLFLDFSLSLKKDPLLTLFPNFFSDFHQHINDRLVSGIRQFYLIPEIERLSSMEQESDVKEKTIYLMALVCATGKNQLGSLILDNLKENEARWTEILGLPSRLIVDYVNNNRNVHAAARELSQLNLASIKATSQPPDPLPWLIYARKVRNAYQKSWITKARLKSLQNEAELGLNLVHKLNRYYLYSKFSKILDSELKELRPTIDIDFIWIQQRGSKINRESIRRFLTFLQTLNIEYPPVQGLSLGQWMETTKGILSLYPKEEGKSITYQFTLAGENFEFDENHWQQLIIRSMITLMMRDFIAENKRSDGLLFFRPEDGFEDIVMNPTNDGKYFFTGKAIVDGRFSRLAFETEVKPALERLTDFLEGLPILNSEKARLSKLVYEETYAYAQRYADYWRRFYRHFDIKSESPGELRLVLTQMQLPTSAFQDFLKTIEENTVLDLGESPYFGALNSELRPFDFMQRVMLQRKDAIPELENYRIILAQMQKDLENGGSAEQSAGENGQEDGASTFTSRLSPLGKLFMAIFLETEGSYLNIGQKWIDNVGIGSDFYFLFLEPFHQAYLLGRAEVEDEIKKQWSAIWTEEMSPVLAKFPFNLNAEVVVTPEELEAVLHPTNGRFWKRFKSSVAPACRQIGMNWKQRSCLMGSITMPKDMLLRVNTAVAISAMLWDSDGLPKPVGYQLQARDLPPAQAGRPIAVRSFVRSGKACAFGFNQKPLWQQFDLEWWKEAPASVGMEFLTPQDSPNIFKSITIPKCTWSFHRLLMKSKRLSNGDVQWELDGPELSDQPVKIRYALRQDPWELFRSIQKER